ncbi:MAG: penicillin-binding protein 2 [Rhodothermia bacterium]|nr:MAG: penicillin-binding protein 2 [Rhodothermia bacterium]
MEEYRTRKRLFVFLICAILGVLVLRLFQLQVIDTLAYSGESRNNAVRERRILPARGSIFDRNGTLLVDNEPAYSLLVTPLYFNPETIPLLAELLALPDSVISQGVQKARKWNSFRTSLLVRGISFDVLSRILENYSRLPGISYEVDQKRLYRTRVRASHVLGYVRQISDTDLKSRRNEGYQPGDLIGQSGLERSYEKTVRGKLGSELNLVNRYGQIIEPFLGGSEDVASESGLNLHLTIDRDMQVLAESLFVNKRGAAVALDVNTGEILAMVSAPDYDLDMFSKPLKPETWEYLTKSAEKPIFNRATSSLLPPGSTFKPFIAMMALEEGVIKPATTIFCPGYHPRGGPTTFRCLHAHGDIAVVEAITKSCNSFFFEMMYRIDVNTFSRYAHAFGFGHEATLDIGEQGKGLIPDSAYYNRVYPDGWNVGTPMSLGVGQGDMGVTPLQLARYIAAIANGGTLVSPHLVQYTEDPLTGEIEYVVPEPVSKIDISPRYYEVVRRGLRGVMTETSPWLEIPGLPTAGKTGTAQNSRGEDDSVFVMYAPLDDPQIAIAVMVENIGFGSMSAGPIASFMAEKYLTGRISPKRNWLFQQVLEDESEPLPKSLAAIGH